MLVREYMTKDPVVVRASDPLSRVGEVFDVQKFRHLPVVDDAGSLVGILSDRDLRNITAAMEILEQSLSHSTGVRVEDVMTSTVTSVAPDANMKEAARIMADLKIGALPVVDNQKLAGILSYTDILRAFVAVAPG
jgi:acetoin utilization protein AcuB